MGQTETETENVINSCPSAPRSPDKERRTHRRVALIQPMKCVRCTDDDGRTATDEIRNISEGGLCLDQSNHRGLIHENDYLKLFVPIPQHDTDRDALCMLVGQVIWCCEDEVGVAFVAPSRESLDTIRAFIDAPRLALHVEV